MSVQKIVPDSDKFQSAERHSSLHSTSWYIPRCFVLPVSGQSIWQYNTRHPRPFHLSQSSKTVPVSTAYLRYAVCRCCLCSQIIMAASIGHQALNFMHSIYDFKSFTMFVIHRRCSKVNILLTKFLQECLHRWILRSRMRKSHKVLSFRSFVTHLSKACYTIRQTRDRCSTQTAYLR